MLALLGNFTLILLGDYAAGLRQVARLAVEKPEAADARADAVLAERRHARGVGRGGEETFGDDVYLFISRLRREDDRHQQLKIGGVFELGGRLRIALSQGGEDLADALFVGHRPRVWGSCGGGVSPKWW